MCVCVCADCSVEVLAKLKGIRCIGYKAGLAFHCFGSVYTAVSSCLALDIRTEKDSRCLCRDCLGWCCLLSDVIYACKSCKCLPFSLYKLHLFELYIDSTTGAYVLQIVGAFWYLLALERNDACWQEACSDAGKKICTTGFLYCGNQNMDGYDVWNKTKEAVLESRCRADLDDPNPPFDFGIYTQALSSGIVSSQKFITKYCYCLWWGLQNLR